MNSYSMIAATARMVAQNHIWFSGPIGDFMYILRKLELLKMKKP